MPFAGGEELSGVGLVHDMVDGLAPDAAYPRSQWAFIRGAWSALIRISISSALKTASKDY
ncbi:hypothetical protein WDA79_21575 [Streptomyces sp. A475]|uniref:hypothetical protein n=1 Tax=Streptomyces sp. A475 TaxID=3131976 RepID=UPI0030C8FADB